MRVVRRLAIVGALVSAVLYGQPWRAAAPAELPFDATAADGHEVRLEGTVRHLDARISRRGNHYYTFDLYAGKGAVRVFRFGVPECTDGSQATVAGVFHHVKRVSGYTFYDEVDAERVRCE